MSEPTEPIELLRYWRERVDEAAMHDIHEIYLLPEEFRALKLQLAEAETEEMFRGYEPRASTFVDSLLGVRVIVETAEERRERHLAALFPPEPYETPFFYRWWRTQNEAHESLAKSFPWSAT